MLDTNEEETMEDPNTCDADPKIEKSDQDDEYSAVQTAIGEKIDKKQNYDVMKGVEGKVGEQTATEANQSMEGNKERVEGDKLNTQGGELDEDRPEFDVEQMRAIVDFAVTSFIQQSVFPPVGTSCFDNVAARVKRMYEGRAGRLYCKSEAKNLMDLVTSLCVR